MYKINLLIAFLYFLTGTSTGQQSISNLDPEKLNKHILNEVNALRNKKRVDTLQNDKALSSAALDHLDYMVSKDRLTHIQRWNKNKKTPKNRADFYESGFEIIGENVQYTNAAQVKKELKENRKVDNEYAALAKVLVENWKNSPPHYANIISKNYINTYTAIKVGEHGKIYACQLFGGSQFRDKHKKERTPVNYKPEKPSRCKRASISKAQLKEKADGTILFVADQKKETGFRFAWPWTEGIAADIVLLSQYPCGEPNRFNPQRGIKGIPLQPVLKKDFRKTGTWSKNKVVIPLGKVPDYISEPYAINLTVVSRNRTCGNVRFNGLSSMIDIKLPLRLKSKVGNPYEFKKTDTTITKKVYFEKGQSDTFLDINLDSLIPHLDTFEIEAVQLTGFASIEGNMKLNKRLYEDRTDTVQKYLIHHGLDSSLFTVSSKENRKAFKEDIQTPKFAHLSELPIDSVKNMLKVNAIREKLEPLLSKHRYVQVDYLLVHKDTVLVPEDTLYQRILESLDERDYKEAERIQKKYIAYYKMNQATIPIDVIENIPLNKRTLDLRYNFLVHNFLMSKSALSLRDALFKEGLVELAQITEKNRNINTALAYFQIIDVLNHGTLNDLKKSFSSLLKNRFLHRAFKYKALLKLTFAHDIALEKMKSNDSPLHPETTRFYRKAGLTTNETFSVAAFYNYVNDQETAYDIVRKVYKETDKYENLHFLLFLTCYEPGLKLDEKQRVRYLQYVAREYPTHFCRYFKVGDLNFQLLDNQNYKDVFCKHCGQ